jgi:tetratricopeptide (TPR) repeat protein
MNKVIKLATFLVLVPLFISANDLWYYSYESGMKAFHAGDLNKAEFKLSSALSAQPTQGKRIKAYGTKFIRYIPDYYLGVIYFRQGRYQEALERLQKAKNAKLVTGNEAEFEELLNYVQLAEEKLKPTQEVPSENMIVPEAIEAKQIPLVADDLYTSFKKEENITVQLNFPPVPKGTREKPEVKVTTDEAELKALVAFYSADYQRAISLLEQVVLKNVQSVKAHFYLGCSYAALALQSGKRNELQRSKEHFTIVRKLNPSYKCDSKYISPRILQLYSR